MAGRRSCGDRPRAGTGARQSLDGGGLGRCRRMSHGLPARPRGATRLRSPPSSGCRAQPLVHARLSRSRPGRRAHGALDRARWGRDLMATRSVWFSAWPCPSPCSQTSLTYKEQVMKNPYSTLLFAVPIPSRMVPRFRQLRAPSPWGRSRCRKMALASFAQSPAISMRA